MSFSKCSPHSSPSCLVLKSPEHQPIHATAPHPLCLFLNLASSLLLALPLGCLSCLLRISALKAPPELRGCSCLPSWPLLVAVLRSCIPSAGRGHHPALTSPWPPNHCRHTPSSGQSCLHFLPSQPDEKKQFLPFSQALCWPSCAALPQGRCCVPLLCPVWDVHVHVHSSSSPPPDYKSSLRVFRNAGFD